MGIRVATYPPAVTSPNPTNTATPRVSTPVITLGSNGYVLNSQDVQPNPFDAYDKVTYHLRLSMVNDSEADKPDFYTNLQSGKTPVVVIAESGRTAQFNITHCEITDYLSSNFRHQGNITTEFRLTITEPYSMTLPDRFHNASIELRNRLWRQSPLVLEIWFMGYDASGIPQNLKKQYYTAYKLLLTDSDLTITEAGSTYELSGSIEGSLGYKDQQFIVPGQLNVAVKKDDAQAIEVNTRKFTPQDNTVGTFLLLLGVELTKYWSISRQSQNPQEQPSADYRRYRFHIAPELAQQEINNSPNENNRRLSFKGNGNVMEIGVQQGTSIANIVNDIFASLKDTNWLSNDPNLTKGGFVRVPVIECKVNRIGWDGFRNDYIREYNFFVGVRQVNRAYANGKQVKQIQGDPKIQTARYKSLRINKEYDYLFTGKNTNILSLDLKFNMLYAVSLPLPDTLSNSAAGDSSQVGSVSYAALQNQNKALLEAPTEGIAANVTTQIVTQNQSRLNALQGEKIELFSGTTPADLGANFTATQSSQATQAQVANKTKIQEAINSIKKIQFAEDIQAAKTQQSQDSQIANGLTSVTTTADNRDIANTMARPTPAGTSQENSTTTTRETYTTVAAQIYEKQYNSMLEIDIEIVGDPYWMGSNDIQRESQLQSFLGGSPTTAPNAVNSNSVVVPISNSSNQVNSLEKDENILVRFRAGAPPDEKTGLMPLTSNSVFFSGVYTVIEVVHSFKDGKFTQKLHAMRDTSIDLQAIGANTTSAPADSSSNTPVVGNGAAKNVTPSNVPATPPANNTPAPTGPAPPTNQPNPIINGGLVDPTVSTLSTAYYY
jgi:hypothetical protein